MKQTDTSTIFAKFLVIAVILFAAIFRFTGVNWDQSTHLHPDERFLTMVATNTAWPTTIGQYFDTKTSPLNPHNRDFPFYVYGTYPVHLTKLIATFTGNASYDGLTLVGRNISAILDLLTLVFVVLISYTLTKNIWVGTLSGFCYAVSVLPIQLSHFFTVDPYVTLFCTITLFRLVRKKVDVVTGITAGLAISAKISAALILPICLIALLSYARWGKETLQSLRQILRQGIGFTMGMLITVRLAYPYIVDGWSMNQKVLNNWKQLASFDGPTTSFPPGIQWIGVPAWQVPLDLLVWGLGVPLGTVTLIAFCYFLFRVIATKKHLTMISVIAWIILAVTYQSLQFAKPMRYIWGVYPALAVLSGIFLYEIGNHSIRGLRNRNCIRGIAALILALLLTVWPLAFMSIYTTTHSRVAANIWLYTSVPSGSIIAWEHWDDPLPFPLHELSPARYTQVSLPSFDPDDTEKNAKIANVLSHAEYLILSSNRAYGAMTRASHRFPKTSKFYDKLFSGTLGYSIQKQFTSRPMIRMPISPRCIRVPLFTYGVVTQSVEECTSAGISVIDDYADESFTVYDHPKVIILKNIRHFSYIDLIALLHD